MNDEKLAEVIQGLSESSLQQAKLLDKFSDWVITLQKQVNELEADVKLLYCKVKDMEQEKENI